MTISYRGVSVSAPVRLVVSPPVEAEHPIAVLPSFTVHQQVHIANDVIGNTGLNVDLNVTSVNIPAGRHTVRLNSPSRPNVYYGGNNQNFIEIGSNNAGSLRIASFFWDPIDGAGTYVFYAISTIDGTETRARFTVVVAEAPEPPEPPDENDDENGEENGENNGEENGEPGSDD